DPNAALLSKSKPYNTTLFRSNGIISLNTCEIFGGTSSGIFIVTFFLTQMLYIITVTNADKNPVNKPLVPRNSLANPPSFIESEAKNKKPQIDANIVDIKLICFVFSNLRLYESVKDLAVVPATNNATIPIVY